MNPSNAQPTVPESRPTSSRPLLITILGPTAIGKTETAIQIAELLQTEIINADSRQVYRGLAIGTAQPNRMERERIHHHFVDFLDVHELYSAGQFESDVLNWLETWFHENSVAVMVGGSGLYVKAVLEGMDELPSDLAIRKELNLRWHSEGLEPLLNELKRLDPTHVQNMDTQNPQRVIRALEVCLASGRPFSAFHSREKKPRPFDMFTIGLECDRQKLNARIDYRVDQMILDGFEEEARSFADQRDLNALQTVGYREWFEYFDGRCSREQAVSNIKLHTRQFAKRQMTWFRKMENIHWVDSVDKEHMRKLLKAAVGDQIWFDQNKLQS